MNALTVDLMGDSPMDEATIQARAQDIIAATWPAWKRERALRLADAVQIAALNAFFDSVAADVDLARENSALLQAALDVEAATARLAMPAIDAGPFTSETSGNALHVDLVFPAGEFRIAANDDWTTTKERDTAERTAAQAVIDAAGSQVLALVASRAEARAPQAEEVPGA